MSSLVTVDMQDYFAEGTLMSRLIVATLVVDPAAEPCACVCVRARVNKVSAHTLAAPARHSLQSHRLHTLHVEFEAR